MSMLNICRCGSKFQVGDRVTVIDRVRGHDESGIIRTVTRVSRSSDGKFSYETDGGDKCGCCGKRYGRGKQYLNATDMVLVPSDQVMNSWLQ